MGIRELGKRLEAVTRWPEAELSGLAALAIVEGETVFEGARGRRYIDPTDPSRDLPVTPDTKFRVASMSKPVVALALMALAERGLVDIRSDVSEYLGWELRNPAWPDRPISAEMLLSHSSSLRDGETYNLPLPHAIEECFRPRTEYWEGGAHFAASRRDRDLSPGRYFAYCNLGFGVLGTLIERVTGKRFDLHMYEDVFPALGMGASFNPNLLSDADFGKLAVLYRKGGDDRSWDPAGPWLAQFDDHRGRRPACPCRLAPGLGPEALEDYVVGTNGTLFSPQGGMRASVRDLGRLVRFLIEGDASNSYLSKASIEDMTRSRWVWDPLLANGDLYGGLSRETGLGLIRITCTKDEAGSDFLLPEGGPRLWGHHADAYGLLGGLAFDRSSRSGYAYIIGGTGRDPEGFRGRYSSWFRWEEEIQRAFVEEAGIGLGVGRRSG